MLDKKLEYLYKLERFEEIKPGLSNMTELLEALANPHRKYPSVHVAGTNGKGSTATLIARAYQEKGLKIGLYTSPYLRSFNERIKINSSNISDVDLAKLIDRVRRAAGNQIKPTFFEFTTAIAFLYFAQTKVDMAVIEVGMGGLLDATNVIKPVAAIITNIGTDHKKWLGETREEIAVRKAGIIKPGVPVITAETDQKIISIFKEQCVRYKSDLYVVDDILQVVGLKRKNNAQTITIISRNNDFLFNVFSKRKIKLTIPLLGEHQVRNLLAAFLTITVLLEIRTKKLPRLNEKWIASGFGKVNLEGRLDFVSQKPRILIDGAHNNEGAAALAKFLEEDKDFKGGILILAIKKDKQMERMISCVVPRFRQVICTEGRYEPLPASQLARRIGGYVKRNRLKRVEVDCVPEIALAINQGKRNLLQGETLLITGSLYMIGDALNLLFPEKNAEKTA